MSKIESFEEYSKRCIDITKKYMLDKKYTYLELRENLSDKDYNFRSHNFKFKRRNSRVLGAKFFTGIPKKYKSIKLIINIKPPRAKPDMLIYKNNKPFINLVFYYYATPGGKRKEKKLNYLDIKLSNMADSKIHTIAIYGIIYFKVAYKLICDLIEEKYKPNPSIFKLGSRCKIIEL